MTAMTLALSYLNESPITCYGRVTDRVTYTREVRLGSESQRGAKTWKADDPSFDDKLGQP